MATQEHLDAPNAPPKPLLTSDFSSSPHYPDYKPTKLDCQRSPERGTLETLLTTNRSLSPPEGKIDRAIAIFLLISRKHQSDPNAGAEDFHSEPINMRTLALSLVALAMLAATATLASAQSAYGIQVPIRGAEEPAVEITAATVDEATGIPTVTANNMNEAAARAVAVSRDPDLIKGGSSRFETIEECVLATDNEGNALLMVSGTARYSSDYNNPDAIRVARRMAYVQAYQNALAQISQSLAKAKLEQSEKLLQTLGRAIDNDTTAEMAKTQREEQIKSSISSLVRGVQIWGCDDDGKNVTVHLFTNNDTATGNRHLNGGKRISSAAEYAAAVDSALDEVMNGFVPPMGGKLIICPESGVATYIGFGSAVVLNTNSGRQFAVTASKLRAQKGLFAVLQGEQVDMTSELKGVESIATTEFQNYNPDMPSGEGEDAALANSFVSALSVQQEVSTAMTVSSRGELPAGCQSKTILDNETGWMTTIYVWSVGSDDLIQSQLGANASYGGSNGQSGASGTPQPEYDPKKRGPSGRGKDPRGGMLPPPGAKAPAFEG